MKRSETIERLMQRVAEGFALSGRRLLEKKQREDAQVVIYRDGRILTIRARDYMPPATGTTTSPQPLS